MKHPSSTCMNGPIDKFSCRCMRRVVYNDGPWVGSPRAMKIGDLMVPVMDVPWSCPWDVQGVHGTSNSSLCLGSTETFEHFFTDWSREERGERVYVDNRFGVYR